MQNIFNKNNNIISEIINRLIDCMQLKKIYIYGDVGNTLDNVYAVTNKEYIEDLLSSNISDLIYLEVNSFEQIQMVIAWLEDNKEKTNYIIYSKTKDILRIIARECKKKVINLKGFSSLNGEIIIGGNLLEPSKEESNINSFKVMAIIHCYNEKDIIKTTIEYLLKQELDIYVVDNWSNDGTYEEVETLKNNYSDRIFLERFPEDKWAEKNGLFERLQRTEEICKEKIYDWYIHYDADEMRITPWENITLREMIYHADRNGFNIIENTVIDFKLTNFYDENIFMKDSYFDFGHKQTHFQQFKTWKRDDNVRIKESGGHIAKIVQPKIYPFKILNRHYPFRSIEQAERKIFVDRRPKLEKVYKEKRWHGHYFSYKEKSDLISKKEDLLFWNKNCKEELFIPLFLGCGIYKENKSVCNWDMELRGRNIVIYGAGEIGKIIYSKYITDNKIVAWVDKEYNTLPMIYGKIIESPAVIKELEYDYVLIAAKRQDVIESIRNTLYKLNVKYENILWNEEQ